MTTTFKPRPAVEANGASGRLSLRSGTRRSRLPEGAIAAGVAVAFALTAVLWHLSTTHRQAMLVLARPVDRGTVLSAADVRVAYVSSDDPIAHLARSQSSRLVGHPARADMAAGTVLTDRSVGTAPSLGAGQAVVGLSLEPGQIPLASLVPGDTVDVVAAGPAAAVATDPAATPAPTIASGALVYAVGPLSAQGHRVVSVALPQAEADAVAAVAERGAVRLVLVGQS